MTPVRERGPVAGSWWPLGGWGRRLGGGGRGAPGGPAGRGWRGPRLSPAPVPLGPAGAAATMGREFGKLTRVRHVITYSLSPFEQRAFPHYFSKGIPNVLRRIQASILRVAPRECPGPGGGRGADSVPGGNARGRQAPRNSPCTPVLLIENTARPLNCHVLVSCYGRGT